MGGMNTWSLMQVSRGQGTRSPAGMEGLLILLKAKWGTIKGFYAEERHNMIYFVKTVL